MAAALHSTFQWVSATGLGSTVVPEENWISARSSGVEGSSSSSPSSTGRRPSSGRACETATPSKREMRASLRTMRAPVAASMRAVRWWNSSRRASRTGG